MALPAELVIYLSYSTHLTHCCVEYQNTTLMSVHIASHFGYQVIIVYTKCLVLGSLVLNIKIFPISDASVQRQFQKKMEISIITELVGGS